MAAPLLGLRRLLRFPGSPNPPLSRSAFRARREDSGNPHWLRVSASYGATIVIWVQIIKKHNNDTREYERRKTERERVFEVV